MGWLEATTELAWGAGFFDGEGSVGVSGRQNSGATRIFASAPQASTNVGDVPAVLTRFHSAVGWLGRIGKPYLDSRSGTYLFQWRTDNFEEVQAVVALLWPHLGPVKRSQARRALIDFGDRQKTLRARKRRRPETARRFAIDSAGRCCDKSQAELAWAAGLFDGEGSTELHLRRASGRAFFGIRTKVSQCDASGIPVVLLRFRDAMGCGWIEGPASGPGYANAYKWASGSAAALTCIERLWPYLGTVKRAQALHVLGRADELPVRRRHPWRAAAASFGATHSIQESAFVYRVSVLAA